VNKLSFRIGDVFFGSDSFPQDPGQVGTLVSGFVATLVSLAGGIFIILIVVGGFMMIAGSGSGNSQQIGRGRTAVTAALIGFLVIAGAYLIVIIFEMMTGIAIL